MKPLELRALVLLRSRPACLLTVLSLSVVSSLAASPTREQQLRAFVDDLVEAAARSARSLPGVLKYYDRIESQKRLELKERYDLHRRLLDAISRHESKAVRRVAKNVLRRPDVKRFPSQVLMLKAISRDAFPAERGERVAWLARFLEDSHVPFSCWAFRLLGDTRWGESVELLLEVMAREEKEGRRGSALWHLAAGELYRVLGAPAYSGDAATLRAVWEELERSVPEKPDYALRTDGDAAPRSAGFFGDKISPRAVFVIDRSSSMRHPARLKRTLETPRTGVRADDQASPSTSTERPETTGDVVEKDSELSDPKIEIVRGELLRAIDRLEALFLFNIVSFDAAQQIWRGGSSGRTTTASGAAKGSKRKSRVKGVARDALQPATRENVASAREFALRLTTGRGTNVYDALDVAMEIPDVDTIYLLSDGSPSRGGTISEIESNMRWKNYLRGVRIVAYGFASEDEDAYDEEFMQRLGAENWGWYRRLNEL